jgi:two-component system alkaline phosphatase synthesis response regulator PhoP
MATQHVLVIEDDPTMAEMVAYNLRRGGFDASVSGDGAQGLGLARDLGVSVVVLDLMLPSMDGMQIARELRRERPELPILMLTARDEAHVKVEGFDAGIDDYVTKPFSMEELVARVKALLRRSSVGRARSGAPEELVFGDLRLNVPDRRCWVGEAEVELRAKEFGLLATLAGSPGKLFSRVELAERVWGYAHLGDTRTIDTHVKNVRRKVEERSSFTYIETVRGSGYRFRVRPSP